MGMFAFTYTIFSALSRLRLARRSVYVRLHADHWIGGAHHLPACSALQDTQASMLRADVRLEACLPHQAWFAELLLQLLGGLPGAQVGLLAIFPKLCPFLLTIHDVCHT